jgi:CHAT domain-containing protein
MFKKYGLIVLLLLLVMGCTPLTPEERDRLHKIMERYDAEDRAKEHKAKRARVTSIEAQLSLSLQKKAQTHKNNKDYRESLSYLKKALSIEEELYWEKRDLETFGKELLADKVFKDGLKKNHKSSKIRDSYILADLYRDMGSVYGKLKENKKALYFYEKVLKNNIDLLVDKNQKSADLYYDMSLIYYANKRYAKAYEFQKKALDIFVGIRGEALSHLSYSEKKSYIENRKYKIDTLLEIASAYQKKNPNNRKIAKEAFKLWLLIKGEVSDIENDLVTLKSQSEFTQDKALLLKIKKLKKVKKEYSNLILQQALKSKSFSIDELQRVEIEKKRLEKALSSKHSVLGDYVLFSYEYRDIFDFKKVSQKLENQLYLDFVKTDRGYYLFTMNGEAQVTLDFLDDNIDNEIKAYRKTIKAFGKKINKSKRSMIAKETKRLAKTLYKKIFKGVNIKEEELLISPDGLLNILPFEALILDNGNYLLQEKQLKYISSLRDFYQRKSERKRRLQGRDVVVLSYLDYRYKKSSKKSQDDGVRGMDKFFNKGLRRLKHTKNEIKTMKTIFGKERIKGYHEKEATKELLYSLNSPQILHFSTHSSYIKDDTLKNEPLVKAVLALSEYNGIISDGNNRGVLTALEFSNLNLYNTELVFFASCESGLGDMAIAEGISGLNKGAKMAGAERIISALWSIDDKESVNLANSFYRHLVKHAGHGKRNLLGSKFREKFHYSKALRSTKLEMITLHPYYWAGVVEYGID